MPQNWSDISLKSFLYTNICSQSFLSYMLLPAFKAIIKC